LNSVKLVEGATADDDHLMPHGQNGRATKADRSTETVTAQEI